MTMISGVNLLHLVHICNESIGWLGCLRFMKGGSDARLSLPNQSVQTNLRMLVTIFFDLSLRPKLNPFMPFSNSGPPKTSSVRLMSVSESSFRFGFCRLCVHLCVVGWCRCAASDVLKSGHAPTLGIVTIAYSCSTLPAPKASETGKKMEQPEEWHGVWHSPALPVAVLSWLRHAIAW